MQSDYWTGCLKCYETGKRFEFPCEFCNASGRVLTIPGDKLLGFLRLILKPECFSDNINMAHQFTFKSRAAPPHSPMMEWMHEEDEEE